MRWGGGGELQLSLKVVYVAQEANLISSPFGQSSVPKHAEGRQQPPHVISGFCGEWVYGEGTEAGFCSIMHYNKSQGPVVYCGKLLRLRPKWFGLKEKILGACWAKP